MSYPITSPLHRIFVENVRTRRISLGLKQIDVAKKLRVSQPAYAAIESGRRAPSIVQVEKVAKALATNPLQLLISVGVASH